MAERTELLMVSQALRNGWNVSDAEITKALALIDQLLQDPTSTARQKERAKKTLIVIRGAKR